MVIEKRCRRLIVRCEAGGNETRGLVKQEGISQTALGVPGSRLTAS